MIATSTLLFPELQAVLERRRVLARASFSGATGRRSWEYPICTVPHDEDTVETGNPVIPMHKKDAD